MTTPEAPGMCPSCHERPADTDVEFSEVVAQRTRSLGWLLRMLGVGNQLQYDLAVAAPERTTQLVSRTTSGRTLSGHVQLCAQCAADYNRSFPLREKGQRAGTIGFIGLVVCAVLLFFVSLNKPAVAVVIVIGIAALAALVVILAGAWMYMRGAALHSTSSRFLRSPAVVAAAEQSDWTYTS